MEEIKKLEEQVGDSNYLNQNCWLIQNLNYAPYNRCKFCELRFHKCLFLQFQLVSLFLVIVFFAIPFLIEWHISLLQIITVFTLIIFYGFFFNRSTENIVKSNFFLKRAEGKLKDLTNNLEEKVEEQTHDIKAKNTELERMLKIQSEFLDITSHQLRTPVSVIKGVSSIMIEPNFEKLPKEKQKQFIQGISEKSAKLESIIRDILTASELDTKKFSVKHNSPLIHLEDVVEQAVKGSSFEAEQRKIDLVFNKPIKPLSRIKGEARFLEQAFANLINNALKYTPSLVQVKEARSQRDAQGLVEVTVNETKDDIVVKVKDNGIGIPKEDLNGLFTKFVRAANASNMYTDGSGLGLYIVKEIVDGHNGKVWVESEVGKGSEFYISLPVALEEKSAN